MRKLPKSAFEDASMYILNNGRQLEKAIYLSYFGNQSYLNVLDELSKYQNIDGGFGNGLESDYMLPDSSPLATSVAFQYLSHEVKSQETIDIVKKGIKYFEDTYDLERNGWYAVPKEVNNFPHAQWWTFDEKTFMTVIDKHWGNPSAEIIGYLYRYKEFLSKLDINFLIDKAIKHLNSLEQFESPHEIYCYIRLYRMLPIKYSDKMDDKINFAVQNLVSCNPEEWSNYVPTPLNFIDEPNASNFGIENLLVEKNLDYLIELLLENKVIKPNWQWNDYELDWKKAQKNWTGVLTLKALKTLDKFNRLEK